MFVIEVWVPDGGDIGGNRYVGPFRRRPAAEAYVESVRRLGDTLDARLIELESAGDARTWPDLERTLPPFVWVPDELIEVEPLDTAGLVQLRIWPDAHCLLTTEKAKALSERLAAVVADMEARVVVAELEQVANDAERSRR